MFFHNFNNLIKQCAGEMMKILLEIDPTHRERQIHFYKKFGFSILSNERKLSSLELNLWQQQKPLSQLEGFFAPN